ncbi:MAG TPA: hypothetical protein DCG87_05890 [Synergistaceae bacterium]|jgi:hypothetical protein|nr:hypothetical protein [Synergistaceae bacterium]
MWKSFLEKTEFLFEDADLYFDVVVLLVAGMAVTLTGLLLFPVYSGLIPYYENGVYGLLLFLFGLQTVSLGRTPAGDMRRTKAVLVLGVTVAAVGIVACFVPDVFTLVPKVVLIICLCMGGLLQLLQMLVSKDKLQAWLGYGGIFLYLAPACGAVYVFSMLAGLLVWEQGLFSASLTAISVLVYGSSIFVVAFLLQKIYRAYPQAAKASGDDFGLDADKAMLLLTGVFMLILGVLLVPVSFGRLPFSGSAQLGLLMVIFSIQMLASGGTPVGPFHRTWLVILFGFVFAALGIVSCVVPNVLVPFLTLLVGLLNLVGGAAGLVKIVVSAVKRMKEADAVPTVLVHLSITQFVMNLVSILFGTSMLISNLIPGWIVGVILTANGCVLLYLMRLLIRIDRLRSDIMEAEYGK